MASYLSSRPSIPGAWQFHSSDHLGTVRQTRDVTAGTYDPRRYWPFGDEYNLGTPAAQRLSFASMERDTEANHFYDHARTHDFNLGRFLSPDRMRGKPAHPQSWNRYTYAANNPMKFIDPTGLDYVLTACAADGNSSACGQQKGLLLNALGSKAYSYLTFGKGGKVTFDGITAKDFGKQFGTVGRGFAGLVESKSVFSLFTDSPGKAAQGGGAFTEVLKGGGANTYIDIASFPRQLGGVQQTHATAFVHEMGHDVGSLFSSYYDAINQRTMRSVLYPNEGYSTTFENRYRSEVGIPVRLFYAFERDYLDPGSISLFPPSYNE